MKKQTKVIRITAYHPDSIVKPCRLPTYPAGIAKHLASSVRISPDRRLHHPHGHHIVVM